MPTYEYVCKKCGHEFEARQPMSAPALKTCPEELCARKKWGRGKVAKQIGAGAGLLFKGGGFYITDYRSEGYKSSAKKDVAPAKPEKKSEAKAAAKPEKK
jgi:putative FmdB family regulatory protein